MAQPPRKLTKIETRYVRKASVPSETCNKCVHWRPPNACHLVMGDIQPLGWCNRWIKRAGTR